MVNKQTANRKWIPPKHALVKNTEDEHESGQRIKGGMSKTHRPTNMQIDGTIIENQVTIAKPFAQYFTQTVVVQGTVFTTDLLELTHKY